MLNRCLLFTISLILLTATLPSASQQPTDPGPHDKCPVCGMFVAKYPNWVTTVLYKNQSPHHFDGAKDLFKYLLDMEKWAQGRDAKDIQGITVKDYYSLKKIDGRLAFYVTGSNVLGPMGHELIPFSTLEDAESFKKDHKGKNIYRFDDIDKNVLAPLKGGMKMMKMKK